MDSYQAQLQKLKAQRQAQLGEINQEANTELPAFQQDRNRTALMAEQNKRRIRDLMARFNTVGGGQNNQLEMDTNTNMENTLTGIDSKEHNYKNYLADKMQNTNAQFDAAEAEALANQQQAYKSSSKEDAANELNSVYVALNQAMRNLGGKEFLEQNEDEIIARFGIKAYDDMLARVQAANMDTQKKLTGKNINTTPQTYSGNIYS